MSDLIYQFSQQVPKDTLTNIGAGISGIVQQKQAAETLRLNQSSYDQLLQSYMDDPNEQTLMNLNQAAIPLGLTDETTAAVGQVQQIRADRAAAELREQQEAKYRDDLKVFMADPTPENWMALSDAASPLGRFDEMVKATENMSAQERQEDARQASLILAPLSVENKQGTLDAIDGLAASLGPDSNEAKNLQAIRRLVEEGKLTEAKTMLSVMAGFTQEGRDMLGNAYELGEIEREEFLTEASLLKTINEFDFATEEERTRVAELADGLPYDLGRALVEMASVRSLLTDPDKGGMTLEDLLRVEGNLRKEYDAYVHSYEIVVDQFDVVFDLYEGFKTPSGMSDTALLTLYNKILDPDSVVREAEAARTEAAAGIIDRADAAVQSLNSGVKFNDETRAALVEAAVLVRDIARREIDKERDRIERTTTELDNISTVLGLQGTTTDRVFPDRRDRETKRRDRQSLIDKVAELYEDPARVRIMMESMTEAEIRVEFEHGVARVEAVEDPPALTGDRLNDFKAYLVATLDGVKMEDFGTMTLEQIAVVNQGSYAAFLEKNPTSTAVER